MIFNEYINKKVVIELKDGSKRFGKILRVDNSNPYFDWIEMFEDRSGCLQVFSSSEIKRVEVLNENL